MNLISAITILFPTLGAFCKIKNLILIKLLLILSFIFLRGHISVYFLTLGIPSLLAAICFKYALQSRLKFRQQIDFILRVLLPLSAIFLFTMHPIGSKAFCYSFYWFIPIFFYLLSKCKIQSNFFAALSSAFTAHATGSIIWLYFSPIQLQASDWINLIPVVVAERFGIALGIFITYKIALALKTNFNFSKTTSIYNK
jgi:hypothetical protein